ncbi:hypothetical protein [Brachyspira intermedia]|uniref:hypothetical protein n=1 Tax=Brachyspira intermedia TaxID=84377 RepID=UPI0011D2308D|nr:hypothetical protein [Brachyspira intermedia]
MKKYKEFSSVQFSSVQFSSVQFSSVQFSSVQFSSVQFSLGYEQSNLIIIPVLLSPSTFCHLAYIFNRIIYPFNQIDSS